MESVGAVSAAAAAAARIGHSTSTLRAFTRLPPNAHRTPPPQRQHQTPTPTRIHRRDKPTDGAPVVPISAQLKYNVDVVAEYIVKRVPVPVRDFVSPPQMIVIR